MIKLVSILLTAVVWIGFTIQVYANGDCGWSPKRRIDYRNGELAKPNFKYDSRVEMSDNTAETYIWCIENKERYNVLNFRWGSRANDQLYYSTFIEPHKLTPTSNSFSGGHAAEIRFIKVKRTFEDDRSWITFNVETIFPTILW